MRTLHCLLLAAGLGAIGCEEAEDGGPIAARVGDAVLPVADLEAGLPTGLDSQTAAAERALAIESWLKEELFYQEAISRRLDENPRLRALFEQSRRSLLIAQLLDEEFDIEIEVSDAAVQEYYDGHRDEFLLLQPQVRARHILLATRRDANARRQALNRGVQFEEVARDHSRDHESKFEGGDLGYFTKADDPVLWEACEELDLNSISKPIRTEYGYHIFQVLDRQEEGTVRGLDSQVRSRIIEQLVRAEHERRLHQFLTRLKENGSWEILDQSPQGIP